MANLRSREKSDDKSSNKQQIEEEIKWGISDEATGRTANNKPNVKQITNHKSRIANHRQDNESNEKPNKKSNGKSQMKGDIKLQTTNEIKD